MIKSNRFEAAYSELMDKTLSVELRSENFIVSYTSDNGNIKSETISKSLYANLVEETGYRMKLSIDAIYIPDILNCFIENGVLYLDENMPFSSQMKAIEDLKVYFYISYSLIKYDGPLKFSEKLFNKFVNPNKGEENKVSNTKAKIRMNLIKLDTTFKNYVEKRIKEIYSSPEERLESITDLTKPIGDFGSFSVQDELEKLSEQMEILARASNYIRNTELTKKARIEKALSSVDEKTRKVFEAQIDEAYQDNYSNVRTNAINEVEGKGHQPLEEIAKEFETKIEAIFKLLTEYYSKNTSIYELMYSGEGDYDVIIARINSIYTYYGKPNPYTEGINNYKAKIKGSLKNQKECSALVEEYKRYLENSLASSEDKAFNLCIKYWKIYQNKIIYGSHPLLIKIGNAVEEFSKAIDTTIGYQKAKETGYRKERVANTVYDHYNDAYQDIIDQIERVYYSKKNKSSMIPIDVEKEYEKLLTQLQNLTAKVQNDLRIIQRENSIQNLLQDNMVNETIGDSSFDSIFERVQIAYNELKLLESFTHMKGLFNSAVIKEHFEKTKNEYQRILRKIYEYYQQEPKEAEYESIIADLNKLIIETKTICENENKLISQYDTISRQKKIM